MGDEVRKGCLNHDSREIMRRRIIFSTLPEAITRGIGKIGSTSTVTYHSRYQVDITVDIPNRLRSSIIQFTHFRSPTSVIHKSCDTTQHDSIKIKQHSPPSSKPKFTPHHYLQISAHAKRESNVHSKSSPVRAKDNAKDGSTSLNPTTCSPTWLHTQEI